MIHLTNITHKTPTPPVVNVSTSPQWRTTPKTPSKHPARSLTVSVGRDERIKPAGCAAGPDGRVSDGCRELLITWRKRYSDYLRVGSTTVDSAVKTVKWSNPGQHAEVLRPKSTGPELNLKQDPYTGRLIELERALQIQPVEKQRKKLNKRKKLGPRPSLKHCISDVWMMCFLF